MNQPIYLDQAIDPMARLFNHSALKYDAYLESTYGHNAHQRVQQWQDHFHEMHKRTTGFLWNYTETRKKRKDTHMVLVGPGFQPTVTDFGQNLQETYLRHVGTLTVLDYSTQVVSAAMRDVQQNTRNHAGRLFGMQFDITNGFSTAYSALLQKSFGASYDFASFQHEAKQLADLSIEELQKRLSNELSDLSLALLSKDEEVTKSPIELIAGGVNGRRSLHLTVNSEYIQPDIFYMPMVIAGTGAAAEREYIWSRFEDMSDSGVVTSDAEKQEFYANIHQLIANYNTIIAVIAFRKILSDNPEASIFAVSDNSTVMHNNDATHPRLHTEELRKLLRTANISFVTTGKNWYWHDEPTHCHGVGSYEVKLSN